MGAVLGVNAQPVDVDGAKLQKQVELAGVPIYLNGAGTRYKVFFKTYVVSLYVTKRTSSAQEAMSLDKPHRLQMTFLTSTGTSGLGHRFVKNIQKGAPKEQMSKMVPGLLAVGNGFQGVNKINPGDALTIDWIPGKGTIFMLNGKQVVDLIKEPEFNTVFMRQWLGESPHDVGIRDQLLGLNG